MNIQTNFILLRGLGRESRHWDAFPALLSVRFPHSQIEMLDVAGNGTEINRSSFKDLHLATLDLRKRSQLIQQNKKPILLSISLGGMIAADWATQFPDELSGIAMINSSDKNSAKLFQRLMPKALLKLFQIGWSLQDREMFERRVLEMTSNRPEQFSGWIKKFVEYPATTPTNIILQLWSASHFGFSEQKPKCPVLLMASLEDHMVSYRCTENIAKKWNLKTQLHANAGHDITLDDPEWVINQVEQWLSK